jgi:hypothetical protein
MSLELGRQLASSCMSELDALEDMGKGHADEVVERSQLIPASLENSRVSFLALSSFGEVAYLLKGSITMSRRHTRETGNTLYVKEKGDNP